MAEKIQRQTQKIFGGKAPTDDLAVFGSFKANNPIYTDSIEDLQSPAYEEGWNAAIIADEAPFLEEMNGLQYGFSKQLAYLFQEGVPEYDINTEYFAGGMVKGFNADNMPVIYHSLTDNNIGNPLSDTTHWAEWISGADIDLSNLSQAGIDKIKEYAEGSGGGLEIGDIGVALYIDETKGKRRWLNGSILAINTNTQGFLSYLKGVQATSPSLFTTEENWQAELTLSAKGQVGKFVIDEIAGTIRLPKIVNIQGLQDLAQAGMRIDAGLPSHTHTRGTQDIVGEFQVGYAGQALGVRRTSGVFYNTNTSGASGASGSGGTLGNEFGFRASRSWTGSTSAPNYSVSINNLNTVQQEAIQYPYFIQIATGQETEVNIVNEIELNNPYTLFDSKYSPNALYNASWLKSEGQWNNGSVYVTCYEGLQVEYNTEIAIGTTVTLPSGTSYTKLGLPVKLSTETYDDYDFVINTADETFRLPLLDGSEDLPTTYINKPLPTSSGQEFTAEYNGLVCVRATTNAVNQFISVFNASTDENNETRPPLNGVESSVVIWVNRGDKYRIYGDVISTIYSHGLIKAKGNGSLYFYVGETVQNANLINAAALAEGLTLKADKTDLAKIKAYITETYVNGKSGYRIWSDGYCEQWGEAYMPANILITIALLKQYNNKEVYNIMLSNMVPQEFRGVISTNIYKIYNNSFEALSYNQAPLIKWKTSGYLTEGEY